MIEVCISRPFHSVDIHINTNSEGLAKQLMAYYRPFIVSACRKGAAKLTALIEANGCNRIFTEQGTFQTNSLFQSTVNFIYENSVISSEIYALHAAAVELKGKAYLLVGATQSGKTTLCTYLTNHGFGYITDDCAGIRRNRLSVLPYPCDIHLRAGGRKVLRNNGISVLTTHMRADETDRYIYRPTNVIECETPIAAICWITRTKDQNSLEQIKPSQLIPLLMKSKIAAGSINLDEIKFLITLTEKVRCVKLCYHELDYVKNILCGI